MAPYVIGAIATMRANVEMRNGVCRKTIEEAIRPLYYVLPHYYYQANGLSHHSFNNFGEF
jgi:hypothetical protein